MPIVDLATLAMEMRDLYPTALQVHSPVSQMMLTMPLPFNVATKLNCKLNYFITSESQFKEDNIIFNYNCCIAINSRP